MQGGGGGGGAVWGKGLHENAMLPSDSSCSTGTACFCVNEANCRLGKIKVVKKFFKKGCLVQFHSRKFFFFIMFYNVLNIFAHTCLHQGGLCDSGHLCLFSELKNNKVISGL